MKKYCLIILLCLCGILILNQLNAEPAFVEGMQDVPLSENMQPLPEELFIYDNLNEHVILSSAVASADEQEKIQAFYKETLPELGWIETAEGRWARDGEKLSIDFDPNGADIFIQFTLETISK